MSRAGRTSRRHKRAARKNLVRARGQRAARHPARAGK